MESKFIKQFLHHQEQDLIISALSSKNPKMSDQITFKVLGPNHYYKAPWRMIPMDGDDEYLICAVSPSWDDIVARRVPGEIAAMIVADVNEHAEDEDDA